MGKWQTHLPDNDDEGVMEDARLESLDVFLSADEERGLGVLIDVLNLFYIKLRQDGYHDSTIAESSKEGNY